MLPQKESSQINGPSVNHMEIINVLQHNSLKKWEHNWLFAENIAGIHIHLMAKIQRAHNHWKARTSITK
jgi:hypothetical protein